MFRIRWPRKWALISLVVFASGWIEIPVPSALLSFDTDREGLRIRVDVDTVKIQWALGRTSVTELRIALDDEQVLSAPRAQLHVGLLPFAKDFRRPRLIELSGPEIRVREELLAKLPQSESRRFPRIAFHVVGGKLEWLMANGQLLAWEVEELEGRLARIQSDVRLAGRMLEPIQSSVRARASTARGLRDWSFVIEGENERVEDAWRPQDIEVLRGMEVRPGQYSFRVAAQGSKGEPVRSELNLNLQNARASITEPPLELSEIQLHASGGLREGVRAEIGALVDNEFRILGQGRAQWPEEGGAWLSLRGDSSAVTVDQDRLDWVRLLHPVTAEILEALEIRGGPEARFALDWHANDSLGWAVHADTSGMRMRYRGIATSSGRKPAFPYPIESTLGDFVATGNWLLLDIEGRAGIGTIDGGGVVELRSDSSGVYLDMQARGVAVDREIRAAATGTPEIIALWRELGIPQGGTTDVDLRIRADDARDHAGVTVAGIGRGVAIRPKEMPIPILLDEVEYFWVDGYSAFDAQARASDSRFRLRGEIRSAQDAEYPGVRAILESEDAALDLHTRRTLVERLGLPPWLNRFAPRKDSRMRLEFQQAATAEAPQFLLALQAQGMELDWGTPLGNRYVPFVSTEELRGPFTVAGARDATRFWTHDLNGKFAGQTVNTAASGGSAGKRNEFVFTSTELELEPATAQALIRLLQLEDIVGPFEVEARSDLVLEWIDERASPLACKLQLNPLRVRLPGERDPLELYGEVRVEDGTLRATQFRLVQGDGEIEFEDLVFYFGADRQELSAILHSARGIELGPQLYQLLGPDAAAALTAVGIRGRATPRGVELRYVREGDEAATVRLENGEFILDHFRSTGPPRIEDGSARVQILDFRWQEDQGLHAELRVDRGRAVVAGIPVGSAQGRLVVRPDSITLEEWDARTLGGWVRAMQPNDPEQPLGVLSIGLTPQAPVRAAFEFGDLKLQQLQNQLDLDSGAYGSLNGWLSIRSPTLEVLDYRGVGQLEIEKGRLTTVPILEQAWGLLGVDPPVFRRGDVKFRLDGNGSVRVEEFKLRHDLLNVEGKGWLHFDGWVQLKVSLRRLRLFLGIPITDLPLLSQFFDLFIEQEVFGPVDRLQVAPRALRKAFGRDLPQVPAPLWLPEVKRTPVGRSPIFPFRVKAPVNDVAPEQSGG